MPIARRTAIARIACCCRKVAAGFVRLTERLDEIGGSPALGIRLLPRRRAGRDHQMLYKTECLYGPLPGVRSPSLVDRAAGDAADLESP